MEEIVRCHMFVTFGTEPPGALAMAKPRLVVVCGVPGSGKSTLAHHAVQRWNAVSFASETFADALGADARTTSGDLSPQAVAHAYSAMGDAVAAALKTSRLVFAVGAFRSEDQRRRFRDIAKRAGASATVLRVSCPVDTAAERVHSRLASGERGPTREAIGQIDATLSWASDIDVVLANEQSVENYYGQVDRLIERLLRSPDDGLPAPRASA